METQDKDTYNLPHNYTDNGKFLGLIPRKSLITALAWFLPATFLTFRFLPFSTDAKIFILILVISPPAVILLAGLGGEPVIDFLAHLRKFLRNKRIYLYTTGDEYDAKTKPETKDSDTGRRKRLAARQGSQKRDRHHPG